MTDLYSSDRHRSWHLCFTLRDFHDAKSFIKDMEKYDRKVLTGLSYWKLNESEEPHLVGTVFEREVNFHYVKEMAKIYKWKRIQNSQR